MREDLIQRPADHFLAVKAEVLTDPDTMEPTKCKVRGALQVGAPLGALKVRLGLIVVGVSGFKPGDHSAAAVLAWARQDEPVLCSRSHTCDGSRRIRASAAVPLEAVGRASLAHGSWHKRALCYSQVAMTCWG